MAEAIEKKRIYYIDSGRALASILGIFYHSALVFTTSWIINVDKSQFSQIILVFQAILTIFRMPLFLFVAGYFTINALRKYDIYGLLLHRSRRILLPFVVSLIVLIPPQEYYRVIFDHGQDWSKYYLNYLNPLSAEFDMEHLWFLYYLCIYTVIVFCLEIFSRHIRIPAIIKKTTEYMHRRFTTTLIFWGGLNIFLGFVSTAIARYLNISSAWIPIFGLGYNLPMFLFGCYCFLDKEGMDRLIHPLKHRIIGTIVLVGILLPLRLYLRPMEFAHSWTTILILDIVLRWTVTLGVLSLLKMFLNSNRPILNYFSNASYPVYLFHQPIIVAIAYLYVSSGTALPALVGYPIICLLSLILTYAAYEIVVRRNRIGSFLFTGNK